jgi:malto-oligosyltrehalose trehalohydrolase
MPFGAELVPGGARFGLWAPSARKVALQLDAPRARATLAMRQGADGWFRLETPLAIAGSRYRYQIDDGLMVPDPASRYNPDDVHGASEVVDPAAFDWQDGDWMGRPWHEAVIYELHVGSFSPEGTFAGVERRLDALADLGVTAIELMPIADFPGRRNWGYDGVLPFAPDASYGRPEDLKRLVQAAHRRGLMVLLDVVYNHFGPEGNYLHAYAEDFFTERHHTPWGAAINFDGEASRTVREFFIHNALYWLEEYHLDGLRLDAVHAIRDDSRPDILEELAAAVRDGPGASRRVHLLLENDDNAAHYLEPQGAGYTAQWSDDIHHCLHVLLTGETDGYYSDYAQDTLALLGRCLTSGFAYQGEPSLYREGARRGEPSAHLPPSCFVSFLQNHDQVGNRAFGERMPELAAPPALRAAVEILLLAPSPPLLFMGEEWAAASRFPFFCDFGPDLAQAVTTGRRREFARFERFRDERAQAEIPDPCDAATFRGAVLDWSQRDAPGHREWLDLYSGLLNLRRRELVPRLEAAPGGSGSFSVARSTVLQARWTLGDGSRYRLLANLGNAPQDAPPRPPGLTLYASPGALDAPDRLPPWSVIWRIGDDDE